MERSYLIQRLEKPFRLNKAQDNDGPAKEGKIVT